MRYESEYYGTQSLPFEGYLQHHGIKGQKWYHRRFQNEDGSLTPAGRERYLTKMQKKYNLVDVPRNTAAAIDNARDIKSNGGSDRVANKYLKKAGAADAVYYSKGKEHYFSDDELDERGQKELKRDKRKFEKLSNNANIGVQKSKVEKYAKYAKISKNVFQVTGTLAVGSIISKTPMYHFAKMRHDQLMKPIKDIEILGKADRQSTWNALKRIADKPNWGVNNPKATAAYDKLAADYWDRSAVRDTKFNDAIEKYNAAGRRLKTAVAIRNAMEAATMVGAVGAGAAYAYNTYRGNKAKKRLTDEGHAKAVRERDEYEERMRRKYGKNWH